MQRSEACALLLIAGRFPASMAAFSASGSAEIFLYTSGQARQAKTEQTCECTRGQTPSRRSSLHSSLRCFG